MVVEVGGEVNCEFTCSAVLVCPGEWIWLVGGQPRQRGRCGTDGDINGEVGMGWEFVWWGKAKANVSGTNVAGEVRDKVGCFDGNIIVGADKGGIWG